MFIKKAKNILCSTLLTLLIIPTLVFAYPSHLIPGGENIGIQINSKGIMIVGMYKVNNYYPGRDAGLKIGDNILTINDQKISNINEMINIINQVNQQEKITIGYKRNNLFYKTTLKLVKTEENLYKTGLYVKDTISGIGTLTYIDPKTKMYGALGHEVIEKSTGQKVEVQTGKIFKSDVLNIEKSNRGSPGEKNARFYSNLVYGDIFKNTTVGIFGTYTSELPNKKLYKVAKPNEVKIGEATMLTVLENSTIEEFTIDIIKLNNNQQKMKNILFNITDAKLLDMTGGIVQGMSGSPIIQDEMIVGAVTHVVIDETSKGYGIFIQHMLEEGNKNKEQN
ncbi:MAG: SpoIVB peptidase [Bacilli bacterium]|jgi:stage IV sporulation protein B